MWIPCRDPWVLWRLGRSIRRSDPHLAATFAIFGRLTAGETMNRGRQAAAVGERVRRRLIHRAAGRLRRARITARWLFSVPASVGLPPAAGRPADGTG
jgi:hypothetical protein